VVSFYTCALIILTAKGDTDYVFTLKKYFGMKGWYIGLIGPTILIFGAITAYFVIIVQSLYPLLVVVLQACGSGVEFKNPNEGPPYWHFDDFSASWLAIVMFVVLVTVSMKKDLSIFLRMGSFGAFCVTTLISFVVIYSIKSMTSNKYEVVISPADLPLLTDVDEALKQYLVLFSQQYTCLGGLLCTGYFLHQCTLPILANAAEPEKNLRNVGIGYFMVFMSYAIVGTLGYIAFSSSEFDEGHADNTYSGVIKLEDNFLNMFDYNSVPAILVRSLIFGQLMCAYPLVNHF